ncbi:alpha/beta fold hydrolase [Intrasporangium calvum]|uniref:Alpha/beta hydrolase fold protein n=1 Tax=Intrasporangium calvum (strain ATCC 23552 / DSM 43043 / JCM 3097 / NBRC 12989 / NCIMB 10167 / NRRL B-3866 / 7 KIP) TaxID=710696 RepID=E6SCP7_INTC7|nr:alpha/beta hydrolase [Intrasporangium calvum]ADU49651.1 alpha/beta hydrolase fold protein [Intrasporangium calvum DSM 43043]
MELTFEETSRTVRTASWTIHYNEAGDPSSPALVLLHGSGPGATGWSNFKSNIGVLADHFRVIAPDMPGWGRSDAVGRSEMDHAKAAIELLDALGIDQAAFVGNSMGGITSLRLVTEYPERVSHLITMGPGSGPQPKLFSAAGGLSEGMKTLVAAYRDPSVESMTRLTEVMTYDSARFATPELAGERAANAQANPTHLANYLEAFAQGGPIAKWFQLDDLTRVEVPALLIHGRDDRVVHYENTLLLLAHIPNSRAVLLNRCGHWAQVEHADEFNRLVIDFVTNN